MFSGNNLEVLCLMARTAPNPLFLLYCNLLFKGTLKLFPDPCTNLNPRQQRFPSLHNFSMRAILSFKVTSRQAVPLHVPMN